MLHGLRGCRLLWGSGRERWWITASWVSGRLVRYVLERSSWRRESTVAEAIEVGVGRLEVAVCHVGSVFGQAMGYLVSHGVIVSDFNS